MNTRIRFLVLDSKNQPITPASLGLNLPGLQSSKSPSILDLATAKLFAQKLAQMHKGQNFYVVTVLGGAVAYDVLDADAPKGTAVSWVDASAAGTDAE